jgi:tetratricopeptide (TPR) repeat protein
LKIFVSYSRTDAGDFAGQIYQGLKDEHDVFTDVNNIQAGDIWSNVIGRNISSCDVFVPIITHAALRSPHVEQEVLQAQRENKKIIPCFHRYVSKNQIKWNLSRFQGVEFDNKYDLARDLYYKIEKSQTERSKAVAVSRSPRFPYNLGSFDPYSLGSFDPYSLGAPYRDKNALVDEGRALISSGRYQEAIKWYDKALAIDPNYKNALLNKGIALTQLGRYNEAITHFDKLLAIDPNDKGALDGKQRALSHLRS